MESSGTPDGKTLYVADIGAGKNVFLRDQTRRRTLENKTLLCEMGSDGMALDAEGNVYLTGKGVTVFDKNRKETDEHPDLRTLDRQREVRRQGSRPTLHHREQESLRREDAREGCSVIVDSSPQRAPGDHATGGNQNES
jgi:predicted peroxiredoxin